MIALLNPQGLAREIVAKRIAITSAVGIVLALLVQLDVIPIGWSQTAQTWVSAVLLALSQLVGIVWTRDGVTPADPALAPMSSAGVRLVEAYEPRHEAAN